MDAEMIACAQCGADGPAGKRFCISCGAALALHCPSCRAIVDAGQRFCGDCGAALEQAVPAPAAAAAHPIAERRTCSVLFVDLVGFTTLSEARDPEDVRELLSRYFDLASTIVTRYGGVVEKFIGDAVMAVWGTPTATEEDAERAVRAALDLVESVDQLGAETGLHGLTARAGVLTGEVAVTVGATNEGMVAGDAVNTAARIQSVAAGGAVLADAVTRKLTEAAITYRDAGEHLLKGKSESDHLWQAVRVVSNVGGEQRVDGLEAPLVGRGPELRSIRDMFHATVDRRQARLMLVSGVAGVGKSRLGWEFDKYVDGLADVVLWHRGRCLSYGEGLTFWALAEAVRQRLSIAEEDPPGVVALRLDEGLAKFVPDPDERDYIGLRLGRLLGVPVAGDTGPTLSSSDLFAGWRRFFERMADVQPVVLLIEDAHRAAPDLLGFLDHLVDWARDLPIFVLVMARPEIDETSTGFGSGRNRVHIALEPLDDASMDVLVDHLVPSMPTQARQQIVERAQGVPLYAVESIRSLIDRDVVQPREGVYALVADIGRLEVPDSLNSLLASRLDSLDRVARKVVTDATILGSSFPTEAVAAVSGLEPDEVAAALGDLVRRGVFEVSADRLSPERGNYRFAQEMLRQAAYESMSRRDRKARHLAVAAHLRATFANDGEEVIDVVARHYWDAFDAVPDDADRDDIHVLAMEALLRAAKRAERTADMGRALACYVDAGERVRAAGRPVEAAELSMRACETMRWSARAAGYAEIALDARDVFVAAGLEREAARALVVAGRARRREGRHTEARRLLMEAWPAFAGERTEDTLSVAQQMAGLEVFAGDQGEAERWTLEALDLVEEIGADGSTYGAAVEMRGMYLNVFSSQRLATMYLREAARAYAQVDDSVGLEQALGNLANSLNADDPLAAVAVGEDALRMCLSNGTLNTVSTVLVNLGLSYLALGAWDDTSRVMFDSPPAHVLIDDEYLAVSQAFFLALRGDPRSRLLLDQADEMLESEDPQDVSTIASARAHLATTEGDLETALKEAMVCVGFLRRELPFSSDDGRWTWPLAARVAHELGRYDLERELLALLHAQRLGAVARMQRAEAALIAARLAAVDGEPDAGERFAAAVVALREQGTPYHLAHGLLDQAEFLGVEHADAAASIDEAATIAESLGCAPLERRAAAIRSVHDAVVTPN